ncbi:PTS mannnose family transporter subunit IIA [Streptococcus cuniculi]|uniref:phosphoenolpyruvate--glycerone phosphotransferase n=1 Tax=Streptococcus cuniculi TaxID=1432788 RepID=A0A1Q8E7F8_9STRE|nr:dihydroxyacetone kinase phosphoryl donor subunit DhaM [Streptococcus cuniculi]OLF47716.1 PTS mannnose family transporter subunit IIA [Streptococcus cuniculi]
MTQTIGIVIVSHSRHLAQGAIDLISEVAKDVPITYCGGLEDGSIGTEFSRVEDAVNSNPAEMILAFFDLGSARMNMEMVADFSDKDIRIQSVPIVEGSYTAAALLQAGAPLEAVLAQLAELEIHK